MTRRARGERLTALLKDLHITIVINNFGKISDIPIRFLVTSGKEIDEIIASNANSTLKVAKIIALG